MDATNQLDDYATALSRAMRDVPNDRVAQEIKETCEHIRQLAEHQRSAGLSEEGAVEEAIRQFGSAKAVGKKLKASWLRANPLARGHLLLGIAGWSLLSFLWEAEKRRICCGIDTHHRSEPWLISCLIAAYLIGFLGYFAMGWIAAAASPKRATFSVATAYFVPFVITVVAQYNAELFHSPYYFAFTSVDIVQGLLAIFGAALAQKWLIRRAHRLA